MNKSLLVLLACAPILFTSCEQKKWLEFVGSLPLEIKSKEEVEVKIKTHPSTSGLTNEDFKIDCSESKYCSASFKREDESKGTYVFSLIAEEVTKETGIIVISYKLASVSIFIDINF